MEHTLFVKTLIAIPAIVNPLGVIPVFLSLRGPITRRSPLHRQDNSDVRRPGPSYLHLDR